MTSRNGPSFATFVSASDAKVEDFVNKLGEPRRVERYFVTPGGPYAYLVHTPPNDVIRPHFHGVDQFQIFYGAAGARYKGAAIEPGKIMIHYADAYSTYGPIDIGAEQLDYFTLRARYDVLTGYVPADRDKLVRTTRHRNLYRTVDAVESTPGLKIIIEPDVDGLAVYRLVLEPGQSAALPADDAGGRYCCVLRGALVNGGVSFGPRSLAWWGPDFSPSQIVAGGSAGADVVIAQFPRDTVEAAHPGTSA